MSTTLKMLPANLARSRRRSPRRGPKDLILDTPFKDRSLLEEALVNAGAKHRYLDEILWAETRDEQHFFCFVKVGEVFDAHFKHNESPAMAQQLVDRVAEQYGVLVQTQVYERVRAEAEKQGMTFKAEHVTEDHTIVVTLEVSD